MSGYRRLEDRAKALMGDFLAQCEAPYVGWSGGKDSTVLLALLADMGRTDVPVLTQTDDLDWPDKLDHCRRVVEVLGFSDYEVRASSVSAADQLQAVLDGRQRDIRGTFSHVIEGYVRDRARTGMILGLRAEESRARAIVRSRHGKVFTGNDGRMRCYPLMDWAGIDVFAAIISRGLPYMGLYDETSRAPHEHRMSWVVAPRFLNEGDGQRLRESNQAVWARLRARWPGLSQWG